MPKMALNKIFWVKGSRVRKTQLKRAGTFLNLEFTVSQKPFLTYPVRLQTQEALYHQGLNLSHVLQIV